MADRIGARDHEAHENLLALSDRMGEMQQQMKDMQRQIDVLSSKQQLQRELENEDDGYMSGGVQKSEESVDQFPIIDQIPPAESWDPKPKRLAYVLVPSQPRKEQHSHKPRKQPKRDSTLKTPLKSIEDDPAKSGQPWTEHEHKKIRKGLRKKLSSREIHLK